MMQVELVNQVQEKSGSGSESNASRGPSTRLDSFGDRDVQGPPLQPPSLARSLQALFMPSPPDSQGPVEQLLSEGKPILPFICYLKVNV